jgi:hypothetical protein
VYKTRVFNEISDTFLPSKPQLTFPFIIAWPVTQFYKLKVHCKANTMYTSTLTVQMKKVHVDGKMMD